MAAPHDFQSHPYCRESFCIMAVGRLAWTVNLSLQGVTEGDINYTPRTVCWRVCVCISTDTLASSRFSVGNGQDTVVMRCYQSAPA